MKTNEYCEVFGISMATFYRHIKCGDIKHIRIGRRILVPIDEDLSNHDRILANPQKLPTRSDLEVFFDKLSPEIIKSFENPPEYGSVKIEVSYHDGRPVRIDCGKSIKKKV